MGIKDFLIYARLPIVLGAVLLMIVAVIYADLPLLSMTSILSIACAAFAISALYSFNSWTDFDEDTVNTPHFAHVGSRSREAILALSLISAGMSLAISFVLGVLSFILIGGILLTGLIYSYPLLRSIGVPRFKEILVFKNVMISIWWSLLPLVAFFAGNSPIGADILLIIIFLFFQFLIESIMRDLPDRHGDAKAGFATIPSALGLKKTLLLLVVFNTISAIAIVASALFLVFNALILIGCAWRYYVILLTYEERPLRFTYEKINFPNYLVLVIGALVGKLIA